jgi:hypothetical protein
MPANVIIVVSASAFARVLLAEDKCVAGEKPHRYTTAGQICRWGAAHRYRAPPLSALLRIEF